VEIIAAETAASKVAARESSAESTPASAFVPVGPTAQSAMPVESDTFRCGSVKTESESSLEPSPESAGAETAENSSTRPKSWAVTIALKLIEIYQRYISPLTPPSCRFYPTCSRYTYEAITRYGLMQGIWLGLKRLCKCHPFHPGGSDPVPELPSSTSQKSMPAGSTREHAHQSARTNNKT
jgi:hypothetical protein